jgi:3',5'-nucleoside bisphosphate phosphatase
MILADLHVHTTCSDGTYSPSEVVELARAKGLKGIAITDHDTIDGMCEALEEGNKSGIEVIPGVEMSVRYKNGEIHILGYDIDPKNQSLVSQLTQLKQSREERNPEIVERLRSFGFDLEYREVKAIAGQATVGRPHIAQVLMKKGYVANIAEAFELYLKEGAPAFVPRTTLEPEKAIGLILGAGGIPVLAHPFRINGGLEATEMLLSNLVQSGLVGIETFYSTHDSSEVELCTKLARRFGLLMTGGSDFHGENKPGIELGSGRGNLRVPYDLVKEMRERVL